MAKLVNIDTPNTDLPQDVQDQIAVQNVRETKQILARQGVTKIVDWYSDNTATTITSTTALVSYHQEAFATNGQYTEIKFRAQCWVSGGDVGILAMYLDGAQVDALVCGSTGTVTTNVGMQTLEYSAVLSAGKHQVNILAAVTAGSMVINYQLSIAKKASLSVTEFIF